MIKAFANWLFRKTHRRELEIIARSVRVDTRFPESMQQLTEAHWRGRIRAIGTVDALQELNLLEGP